MELIYVGIRGKNSRDYHNYGTTIDHPLNYILWFSHCLVHQWKGNHCPGVDGRSMRKVNHFGRVGQVYRLAKQIQTSYCTLLLSFSLLLKIAMLWICESSFLSSINGQCSIVMLNHQHIILWFFSNVWISEQPHSLFFFRGCSIQFHPLFSKKNQKRSTCPFGRSIHKMHIAIEAMAIEIVDLPIDSMVMFNSELLNVYQRVTWMMIH